MYHKLSQKNAYGFFNSISGLSTLSDKDKQTFDLDNIMRLYNLQGKLNRKLLNFAYIQKKNIHKLGNFLNTFVRMILTMINLKLF